MCECAGEVLKESNLRSNQQERVLLVEEEAPFSRFLLFFSTRETLFLSPDQLYYSKEPALCN
jgi:hypothetical protein